MKTIIIGVIILIIIGVGAYALIKKSSTPAAQPVAQGAAAGTTAAPSDQVQAQDVTIGTGKEAAPGTVVSVMYVAKLKDGTVFDSSAAHNNQPLTFQLGSQGLIPGFQIGVNTMKEGGKRVILVPAAMGYGAQDVKDASGKVIIPANSDLIFEIELVKVEPAPSATPTEAASPTPKEN